MLTEFAAGRHCGQMGQKNMERQWERLADALNGLGNVKTVAQWQKVGTYFLKIFYNHFYVLTFRKVAIFQV